MKKMLDAVSRGFCRRLSDEGFAAYAVGGTVRDLLLGRAIRDVDLATSARPEEVLRVFSDLRVIETGIAHGTVTVLDSEGNSAEITTFRTESDYSDARHPDQVEFVQTIEEDLARRDFTVGAMAMDADGRLVDPFGGERDLAAGILRAVGDPDRRFREDALRILRLVRFSSELGFRMEEHTRLAAEAAAETLKLVARERVYHEFVRLLCGEYVTQALLSAREIVAAIVGEVRACFDFDQRSVYHAYDVYEHIARSVGAVKPEKTLRLAAFYHDIGKPEVYTLGEDGHGHFKDHAAHSARIARESLTHLRAPTSLVRQVTQLVEQHDRVLFAGRRSVRRALNELGEDALRELVELSRADTLSHAACCRDERLLQLDEFEALLEEELSRGACFSLKQLAVNGEDLKTLGVSPSKQMGELLGALLSAVLEGDVQNEREALLAFARKLLARDGACEGLHRVL